MYVEYMFWETYKKRVRIYIKNQFKGNIRSSQFLARKMLKFGTYFVYVFVVSYQYGMAESQEYRDSVGVLKVSESQRPLYEKFLRRQQEMDYINFFLYIILYTNAFF